MKKLLSVGGFILLILVGFGLLFYPDISNWLGEQNHAKAIQEYDVTIADRNTRQREAERQKAREYNDALSGTTIRDPFIPGSGAVLPENYASVLNIKGTIGYINIPKINVNLPIYHGTSEEVLNKGVGHLENTAFPIGGKNNHAVLTGHRGLSSAKLFTDLDKLDVGDIFYIHVLDETLAYQVDQVLVVEPNVTENLRSVKGEDYVSLVTCTPYSVNTHRLLVRGTHVPYDGDEAEQTVVTEGVINWRVVIIVSFAVLVGIICWVIRYRKRRRK